MKRLTPRQQAILKVIRAHGRDGVTFRQIQLALARKQGRVERPRR